MEASSWRKVVCLCCGKSTATPIARKHGHKDDDFFRSFLLTATLMGYSYTCQPIDWEYQRDPLNMRVSLSAFIKQVGLNCQLYNQILSSSYLSSSTSSNLWHPTTLFVFYQSHKVFLGIYITIENKLTKTERLEAA